MTSGREMSGEILWALNVNLKKGKIRKIKSQFPILPTPGDCHTIFQILLACAINTGIYVFTKLISRGNGVCVFLNQFSREAF